MLLLNTPSSTTQGAYGNPSVGYGIPGQGDYYDGYGYAPSQRSYGGYNPRGPKGGAPGLDSYAQGGGSKPPYDRQGGSDSQSAGNTSLNGPVAAAAAAGAPGQGAAPGRQVYGGPGSNPYASQGRSQW